MLKKQKCNGVNKKSRHVNNEGTFFVSFKKQESQLALVLLEHNAQF